MLALFPQSTAVPFFPLQCTSCRSMRHEIKKRPKQKEKKGRTEWQNVNTHPSQQPRTHSHRRSIKRWIWANVYGGQVDPLSYSGDCRLRQIGSRERRRGKGLGRWRKRRRKRQQTARSLCGRAAWPLALSPASPLLLLLLLLSNDDRTEKNKGGSGLGRTVLQIGKTSKIFYSSWNAVTLHII